MIAKSQYLDHSYSLLEDFIKLSILFLLVAFIYMFLSKMTEQIFLTMAPSESVLRSVVWWVASIFNLALAIAVSAIILPVALAAFVYIFAIWHGLSIRMENFVFRWNIFHYEVFYANPDILLAEYMNYKEWMGCRCSDFQRRVMKFKLRSRWSLHIASWHAYHFVADVQNVIQQRQRTAAFWYYNFSNFTPVSPDWRIQFGVYKALNAWDWLTYTQKVNFVPDLEENPEKEGLKKMLYTYLYQGIFDDSSGRYRTYFPNKAPSHRETLIQVVFHPRRFKEVFSKHYWHDYPINAKATIEPVTYKFKFRFVLAGWSNIEKTFAHHHFEKIGLKM